jgi:predicted DNA-binding protein
MGDTKMTAFRLPVELIARLDTHAKRLGTKFPGMTFTRADALKTLVTQGLDQAEAEERAVRPGKKGAQR